MNLQIAEDWAIRHRTLALIVLGALLYIAFLGQRDLWFPSEPDLAEVARAMSLSGDWITPRAMGVIWVDYPPMIYWAGNISAYLLGDMSAFSLRLPNALAAIVTAVITGAAGKRWFDARTGFWAGLASLTFFTFLYEGISYRPDMLFSVMITAGIIAYADGVGERPRLMFRVAGFALFGLAMLSKGPLGLLLPGLVLVLWHGARQEWRRILELVPLSVIAIAVYFPWFAATAKAMDWSNMLYEFYAQNFERFVDGSRGHEQPLLYYARNFWFDLAPWSWLAPAAIWWIVRAERWRDPKVQLALWWFGAFFVFLSLAVTKRQMYLLPAYPAMALLLGPWLATVGRAPSTAADESPGTRPVSIYSLLLAIVFSIIGIALCVFAGAFESLITRVDLGRFLIEDVQGLRAPLGIFGVSLLAAGLWIGAAWRQSDTRAGLFRIGAAHVVLYALLLGLILPAAEPMKTYAPASAWLRDQIGSEEHIGMVWPGRVIKKRAAFAFYTGAMVDIVDDQAQVEHFFQEHPTSVVLVYEGLADLIFAGDESAWQARVIHELRAAGHRYLVLRGPIKGERPADQAE